MVNMIILYDDDTEVDKGCFMVVEDSLPYRLQLRLDRLFVKVCHVDCQS